MRFEGSLFSVAGPNTPFLPVFRLANTVNGAYLYTTNAEERDYAVSLGSWRFEGSTFNASKGSALAGKSWSKAVNLLNLNGQIVPSSNSQQPDDLFSNVVMNDNGDIAVVFSVV